MNDNRFCIVGFLFPNGIIRIVKASEWPMYAEALSGMPEGMKFVLREMRFPINDWQLEICIVVPEFVDYAEIVPAFQFVFNEFAPMLKDVFLSDLNSVFDDGVPF